MAGEGLNTRAPARAPGNTSQTMGRTAGGAARSTGVGGGGYMGG